eukprot:GHRR01019172.1.p2 GENE.GHRR01019172.1~~GHRR01019172.1.p2  ORF type:complete len:102 (-),score=8.75 GHRR01019172.1:350-655(-)
MSFCGSSSLTTLRASAVKLGIMAAYSCARRSSRVDWYMLPSLPTTIRPRTPLCLETLSMVSCTDEPSGCAAVACRWTVSLSHDVYCFWQLSASIFTHHLCY